MATRSADPPQDPNAFCSEPSLDGDVVVFLCDGAVWQVAAGGGRAERRTKRFPQISGPIVDSRRELLAFTAAQHGPPQVHVKRADKLRQLTKLSKACRVLGWSADRRVVFVSSAGSPFPQNYHGWLVDPDTAELEMLPFRWLAHFCQRDDGASVLSTPSVDPRTWREYRGGAMGEIWIDPDGSGGFRRIIPAAGNLSTPLLCGPRVYFVLENLGQSNIHSCAFDGSDLQQHTFHEGYAVHSPATDDSRIVYACRIGRRHRTSPIVGRTQAGRHDRAQ